MKNGRYLVNRDDIYVGKVIDTTAIGKEHDCETLCAGPYLPFRTILFVLTEDGLADDLLYDSQHYPILNITERNVLLTKPVYTKHGQIVVDKAQNIGELLKFYGYGDKLNMFDILDIRKTIFGKKFLEKHCEDFGFHNFGEMGYGSFDTQKPLFEMFSVLSDLSDGCVDNGRNAFSPKHGEGRTRKLIRPKGESIPTTK